MDLLLNIINAAHANNTYHEVAFDALRYLPCERADEWRAVFLKHAEQHLIGSNMPDEEFKDFKNHVLHFRDDYWHGHQRKLKAGTTCVFER